MKSRIEKLIIDKSHKEGRLITQAEIAAKTGVHPSTISRIKHGGVKRLEEEAIVKLCEYFGCELGDLMYIDWTAEGYDIPEKKANGA